MNTTQSGTSQKWEGRWDQLVGRVKKLWGQVTDDELMQAKGDYERLLGIVKERTGRTREQIEEALNKS